MNYLSSAKRQFQFYKKLGEQAMDQISDADLFWHQDEECNSIATIIKHLCGNMLSRWTNFLTEDGEKAWRNRDAEFDGAIETREEVMLLWHKGWQCLFDALESITDNDLEKIIYIRNEGHTVLEAINRQLAHYPYHIGQIIFIAKMRRKDDWKTLSIARNKSNDYNAGKFSQEKEVRHFTDDFLNK